MRKFRFVLKLFLALTLVGAFFVAVVTLGNNNKVYASESEGTEIVDTLVEETTTTTTEEEVVTTTDTTTTEEEENLTLTEEEKAQGLDEYENWLKITGIDIESVK